MQYGILINNGYDHGIFNRNTIQEEMWEKYTCKYKTVVRQTFMDKFETFEIFINTDNNTLEIFVRPNKGIIEPDSFPWDIFVLNYSGEYEDGKQGLFEHIMKLMDKPEYLI